MKWMCRTTNPQHEPETIDIEACNPLLDEIEMLMCIHGRGLMTCTSAMRRVKAAIKEYDKLKEKG